MTEHLRVEYRKVETLIPFARNPRTHSEAQVAKLAASIVEFGWTSPSWSMGANGIIAGHGRLAAARKLDLPKCRSSNSATSPRRRSAPT
jgi:ParB-like chromosome segregation protein Spo0J